MIARRPFAALRIDEERRRGEVDLRVGIAEIEAGRDFSVAQRQRSLDQSGEPSRLFQVSNIGLDRADSAETARLRSGAERAGQCVDLQRFADSRERSMAVEIS